MRKFVSAEEYDERKRLQQEYQKKYVAELKKDKPELSKDTK